MIPAPLSSRAGELLQQESLNPALTRALRGTVGFVVPLIVAQIFKIPAEISFAAVGAQVVALTDVRGAYRFRFVILLIVTAAITAAALMGTLASGHLVISVLSIAALAVLAGTARHLSGDYGPGLGIVAALLFIMALAIPSGNQPWWHHAAFTFAGGLWGVALQALLWPFRPQHALRQAVAETWVSVSDVFAALKNPTADDPKARHERLAQCERDLRTAIDRTQAVLAAARTRRTSALMDHLEDLRVEAARLGNRAAALNASVELLASHRCFARIAPSLDSLLLALTNLTRSVALTVISHRPVHFSASEVRLTRCLHLIEGLSEQVRALPPEGTGMLLETLRQLHELLAGLKVMLHDTVDRGAVREGFPLRLPELSTLSPRSLFSWINPAAQIDPLLVRHTLRMAAMTMFAIALYEGLGIHRGYWIAFTLIVVLQPDYGSTRQKAGQRILGTLAGSAVASAFLWVRMPLPVLDALIAVTVFGFAYYQKQRYALAVFFVTLMLVLLTETAGAVHLDFTISRLLCNLAGGVLALVSALLFWPSWERDRFPVAMAGALRAGDNYLAAVIDGLVNGHPFNADTLHAKRRAETANSIAAASLQRMAGEPARRQSNIERGGALLHGNTRITRAITALTLHLQDGQSLSAPGLIQVSVRIRTALSSLAQGVEADASASDEVCSQITALDSITGTSDDARLHLIHTQLAKIATELRAMTLAMNTHPPVTPTDL
ncbi:FUSC family protein [Rariglobus hedericola]|uniref:Uncharacterized protein n=1 Tax=Rariglobus hedericola TaxID=2597822 RepID=A0A556QEJ6_9BACT|nr:FUSC family protein [Rariglobus hedericola]TSJ75074.1 hypothetical protein FPL22_16890 [Rariglobus hedericola]